jgi:predicted transcriptional regulator
MTLQNICKELSCEIISGKALLQRNVEGAYASDLLSDVMGYSKEGQIWITLQTHRNVIAIASLKELSAVVLVKGFLPEPEVVELAEKEEVVLLSTGLNTYEFCGRLHQLIGATNRKTEA